MNVTSSFVLDCEYGEGLMNFWPKMGSGTRLLEQCNLSKPRNLCVCGWSFCLLKIMKVFLLYQFEEFVELGVLSPVV